MEQRAKTRDRAPDRRRPRRPEPPAHKVRMERRNLIILAASGGVIVVGFVALALGSTTVAALLLVVGFLVGVPLGLLARERPRPGGGGSASGG